ncbi:MAG TPA: alpha/beta fold hydrolase [Vicinamibacterales bacterium]
MTSALPVAAEAKVEKLAFGSGGATRSYYLFIPDKAAGGPAPLLLLLHGSGHDGKSLIDPWLPLAKSEGIVLVAPDASNPQAWRIPQEGPDFFYDLIELVRISHADVVDDRRIYVFGHSAGAIHGLDLGLLESEYFAAVAVHAGAVSPEMAPLLDQAPRKIPMAIWVGTNDAAFPLAVVRQTRDTLNAHGFDTRLTEIRNHTHDYYGSSSSINKEAWAFLQQHKLAADPKFQPYRLIK